jgi:hypothetical protein
VPERARAYRRRVLPRCPAYRGCERLRGLSGPPSRLWVSPSEEGITTDGGDQKGKCGVQAGSGLNTGIASTFRVATGGHPWCPLRKSWLEHRDCGLVRAPPGRRYRRAPYARFWLEHRDCGLLGAPPGRHQGTTRAPLGCRYRLFRGAPVAGWPSRASRPARLHDRPGSAPQGWGACVQQRITNRGTSGPSQFATKKPCIWISRSSPDGRRAPRSAQTGDPMGQAQSASQRLETHVVAAPARQGGVRRGGVAPLGQPAKSEAGTSLSERIRAGSGKAARTEDSVGALSIPGEGTRPPWGVGEQSRVHFGTFPVRDQKALHMDFSLFTRRPRSSEIGPDG